MKIRAMFTVLGLAALCGCAAGPSLRPIPRDETVAFVVAPSAAANVLITNQSVGHDAAVGGGAGAVAGGLWGLACGPLAILCVPLTAAIGLGTGTVAGAAVGLTGALPADKAQQLRDRLARLSQAHDLQAELHGEIAQRAGRYWRLAAADGARGGEGPQRTVQVELLDIAFAVDRAEQVGLVLRVRVAVHEPGAVLSAKTYAVQGPVSALAVWLDERSDFFDTSLSSALRQTASQIVAELAPR